MKFSETESHLLIEILKNSLQTETDKNKKEVTELLIQKIEQQEYIKGRLLKSLYTEVVNHINNAPIPNTTLETLANQIKFKTTPKIINTKASYICNWLLI